MAESSYNCSVRQGLNFEKDAQITVGFINSLKVADQELKVDFHVTNPEDIKGSPIAVAGVLSAIYWGGGYADAIQLSCQISNENQQLMATLIHTDLSNTEVDFEFTVYDYDPREKKYYQCFNCGGTKLKGLVAKQGGELQMAVSNEASMEIASPKNFSFNLGIMPSETEMQIHLATSTTGKFVKAFGVKVA